MMGFINTVEFQDLWNSTRNEIRGTLKQVDFKDLEKCVKRVIDEEYFDPKLVRLVRRTPLEKYTELIIEMKEPLSIDSSSLDEEGNLIEIQIPDKKPNPEDELLESERKDIDEQKLDNALSKAKTFKERRIVKEIKKIRSRNEEINYSNLARTFNTTPQAILQFLKRLANR